MKKTSLAALALCAVAGVASANPLAGLSGDIGVGTLNASGSGASLGEKATQVRATVSYVLAPNIAGEVMGSTTWSKGSDTGAPYTVTGAPEVWRDSAKFSATTLGVYVRPHYEVSPGIELYGRAGISHNRMKVTDSKSTTTIQNHTVTVDYPEWNGSANKTGFSYGVGVKGTFNKNWTASLDYMNYYDKNGIKLDGFTLSTGYAF